MTADLDELDVALGEVLGDRGPPDVSFRVLRVLQHGEVARKGSPVRRSRVLLALAFAAVVAASIWWLRPGSSGVEPPTVTEWSVGDRLSNPGLDPLRVPAGRLGSVSLSPGAEVEWIASEVDADKQPAHWILAVRAGAVSYVSDRDEVRADRGEYLHVTRRGGVTLVSKRSRSSTEPAAEPDGAARVPTEPPVAADALTWQPIRYPGFDLDVDWEEVGALMATLTKLYRRYVDAVATHGRPPVELTARIDELNGQLIQRTAVLLDRGLPGMTHNSVVRHPVLVANSVLALLAAEQVPLDERQRQLLVAACIEHADRDEQRRRREVPSRTDLERYIDELELRDRFMEAVRPLLDARQRALLFSAEYPDVIGIDLLSTDFAWTSWVHAVYAADREELAVSVVRDLASRIGVGRPLRDRLLAVVRDWAYEYPERWWSEPPTALDRHARFQRARVRDAAGRQVELTRAVHDRLPLTNSQRRRLAALAVIYLPFRDQ